MIATFVRVVLLTLVWGALQGSFGPGPLILGALFSWAILQLTRPLFNAEEQNVVDAGGPVRRIWRCLVLIVVFLREVVLSALEVAQYVLQPSLDIRPAIIEYPLTVQTDREITMLANMISLTPGTLSMDVSADRSAIYVHAISVTTEDGQEVIDDIKGSLEKHVHRALGPIN
jgi:multicomponent Na+:H+ antiporter subunit E